MRTQRVIAIGRIALIPVIIGLLALAATLLPHADRAQAAGSIIYVNKAAAPGGNGATWATAYQHLQDALAVAGAGDEIWIARGIYYPDEGASAVPDQVVQFFELTGGVSLYGGFSGNGTETSHDQADPAKYMTVLSGDIDQNDSTDANGITSSFGGVTGQNAERVLLCYQQTGLVVIDGVVVTGGNAGARTSGNQANGAGLLLEDCAAEIREVSFIGNRAFYLTSRGAGLTSVGAYDSLTIANSTFRNNYAKSGGGGLWNADDADRDPPVTVTDSLFQGNQANPEGDICILGVSGGGGALFDNHSGNTVLERVTFRDNLTRCYGGGIERVFAGNLTIRNSVFTGNRAERSAAAAVDPQRQGEGTGGAISSQLRAALKIESSLIAGNYAAQVGGGVNLEGADKLINVTVTGNTAGNRGGGIHSNPSGFGNINVQLLANSIVHGNAAAVDGANVYAVSPTDFEVSHSLIGGSGGSTGWDPAVGKDLGGNIDVPPGFRDVVPGDPVASNYRLILGSPAIDVGDNAAVSVATDLDGEPRIFNSTVDMGAYELHIICPAGSVTRLYVDDTATGTGLGDSWTNAIPRLQDALTLAQICPSNNISEVWVAQGTYYPDNGDYHLDGDRAAAFELRNGLSIYGGFRGSETSLSQRDPWSYISTLSGDIDQDDTTDAHDLVETPADIVGDNSYHVVIGTNTGGSARLDGFAVTAGQANGSPAANQHEGGGLFAGAGNATLNNLAFIGNIATEGGAMALVFGSQPAISNALFDGNAAVNYGGALHNENSNPTLINVQMSGNRAALSGGAIFNLSSSPTLTNVSIGGNAAGGTVAAAGVTPAAADAAPRGGGIFNLTSSSPLIRNSIIWTNQDSSGIGTPTSSIFNQDTGSTPSADSSNIQGLGGINQLIYDGTSIDADPLFVVAVDPNAAPVFTPALRLKTGSPSIDVGKNSLNSLPTDLTGAQARIQDGNGDGSAIIDMGAFEAPALLTPQIDVEKSANVATANVGDTITYNYVVTNTGHITVALVAVDDKLGAVTLTPTSIGPGATATGSLNYAATAGDVPTIVNTVHVTGTTTSGAQALAADTAHVDLQVSTSMRVTKTASALSGEVGDTITYTYQVENIGGVNLESVEAVDDKLGAVTLASTTVTPGNSTQGILTYVLTENDLPIVNNLVTVTATVGISTEVEHAGASVKVTSTPALAVHKTSSTARAKVGETVNYGFEVRNIGDVTLTNVAVNDNKLGAITLASTTLAPGASITGTASHVVTGSDLPGPVTNTATATSKSPTGTTVAGQDNASVSVSYRPRVDVIVTVAPSNASPGDVVTYSYSVKNTGDVELTNLTLVDDRLGPITLSTTTLAPGATATGSKTYTVQTTDAGTILINTATAGAGTPTGGTIQGSGSTSLTVPPSVAVGVILTESYGVSDLDEDGTPIALACYWVTLESQPSAPVTVKPDNLSLVTVHPSQIVLDSSNWDDLGAVSNRLCIYPVQDHVVNPRNPQCADMKVDLYGTGAVDKQVCGTHLGAVDHLFTSSDANYNGSGVPVTGNGPDFGTGPRVIDVLLRDDDTAGITFSPAALNVLEGGVANYTVALRTQPASTVNVTVAGSSVVAAQVQATTLTFTPQDWNVPQAVSLTLPDDDDVNGIRVDSISHTVSSSDGNYNALPQDRVSLPMTITDDDAASAVLSRGSLAVTEGGAGDSYELYLTTQPSADVVITVDGGEQVAASPRQLTFTPNNWNVAQTVNVNAVDDAVDEASVSNATVRHTASSGDPAYNGAAIGDLLTEVTDNDTAALAVGSPAATRITEGESTSYGVTLATQPTASVQVYVVTDGKTTADPIVLNFDASNWNVAQTVTLTSVDDNVTDSVAVRTSVVNHVAVSDDANYNQAIDEGLSVEIIDDDLPAIQLSTNAVSVAQGGQASYSVTLASQPSASVIVVLTPSSGLTLDVECAIASESVSQCLVFTPENWNVAQSLTLTALTGTPEHIDHLAMSSDQGYNGLTAQLLVNVAPLQNPVFLPLVAKP